MYFSKRKATTAKIRSQVCSARKPTALAAVLKRKVAIWPISPGSGEPSFAAISLRPFAIAFPVAFKPFVIELITAPIVTPAARRMAVTVTPFFLKISLILAKAGPLLFQRSSAAIAQALRFFLLFCLSLAASLSEGDVSAASMIA